MRGFSLIELSIVLVIIGLLVAGTVGGKALIHSARLNRIIGEFNQLETAFNTFHLQYNYWPGDDPIASQYWPSTYVENGNGNNFIGDDGSGTCGYMFLPWLHLQLAEILPGKYTGCEQPGNLWIRPNVNVPPTKFHYQGYYDAYTFNNGPQDGDHFIRLRRMQTKNPYREDAAVMTVKDAMALSRKYNGAKGKPGMGKAIFGSGHQEDTYGQAYLGYCDGGGTPETSYWRMQDLNLEVCIMEIKLADR